MKLSNLKPEGLPGSKTHLFLPSSEIQGMCSGSLGKVLNRRSILLSLSPFDYIKGVCIRRKEGTSEESNNFCVIETCPNATMNHLWWRRGGLEDGIKIPYEHQIAERPIENVVLIVKEGEVNQMI